MTADAADAPPTDAPVITRRDPDFHRGGNATSTIPA